jgi:hypothetical protein
MPISLASVPFLLAFLLAALMGFAIQRGATCTVAAVDEILAQRTARRLLAMLEASLWVAGGLLIGTLLQLTMFAPAGVPLTASLVLGGVLLGLGAFVNRGCVFGAIARLSNGEWAYLATPLGFLAGCALQQMLPAQGAPLPQASPVIAAARWTVWLFALFVLVRLLLAAWPGHRRRQRWFSAAAWTPGAATVVIGIAFVLMLLLVGGSWAYTDVLAELAAGRSMPVGWRLLLLLALYSGGLLGGYTAGRWRPVRPSWQGLARCFAGGALMGLGSLLIPGSNDGLILLGMPLLLPHAWVAFGTMCMTVALAMLAGRRIDRAVTQRRQGRAAN